MSLHSFFTCSQKIDPNLSKDIKSKHAKSTWFKKIKKKTRQLKRLSARVHRSSESAQTSRAYLQTHRAQTPNATYPGSPTFDHTQKSLTERARFCPLSDQPKSFCTRLGKGNTKQLISWNEQRYCTPCNDQELRMTTSQSPRCPGLKLQKTDRTVKPLWSRGWKHTMIIEIAVKRSSTYQCSLLGWQLADLVNHDTLNATNMS